MKSPFDDLADMFANDIFIADGGVDDFDEMSESEIRQIVFRELPNYIVELVTLAAVALQRERREENNV